MIYRPTDYILSPFPVLQKKTCIPQPRRARSHFEKPREEGIQEEGERRKWKNGEKSKREKKEVALLGIDVSSRWSDTGWKGEGEGKRSWLIRKACVHDVLERLAAVLHRTLTLRYRRLAATTLSRFGLSHLFRSTLSVRRLLKSLSRGPSPVKSSWRNAARKWRERSFCFLPFILSLFSSSSSPFYLFLLLPDCARSTHENCETSLATRANARIFENSFLRILLWSWIKFLGKKFWRKDLKEELRIGTSALKYSRNSKWYIFFSFYLSL